MSNCILKDLIRRTKSNELKWKQSTVPNHLNAVDNNNNKYEIGVINGHNVVSFNNTTINGDYTERHALREAAINQIYGCPTPATSIDLLDLLFNKTLNDEITWKISCIGVETSYKGHTYTLSTVTDRVYMNKENVSGTGISLDIDENKFKNLLRLAKGSIVQIALR